MQPAARLIARDMTVPKTQWVETRYLYELDIGILPTKSSSRSIVVPSPVLAWVLTLTFVLSFTQKMNSKSTSRGIAGFSLSTASKEIRRYCDHSFFSHSITLPMLVLSCEHSVEAYDGYKIAVRI